MNENTDDIKIVGFLRDVKVKNLYIPGSTVKPVPTKVMAELRALARNDVVDLTARRLTIALSAAFRSPSHKSTLRVVPCDTCQAGTMRRITICPDCKGHGHTVTL